MFVCSSLFYGYKLSFFNFVFLKKGREGLEEKGKRKFLFLLGEGSFPPLGGIFNSVGAMVCQGIEVGGGFDCCEGSPHSGAGGAGL